MGLFLPGLVSFFRRRTRDREAAQELADDALMAVLRAMRDARIRDAARLAGFVRGTARNLANNHLRARRSRPREEPLAPDLAMAPATDVLERQERLAVLQRGLARLGTRARRILLMTLVDGLKPGQIARRLGLSPQVVRARKARALRTLATVAQGRPVGPRARGGA